MNTTNKRNLALAHLFLISPALVFMGALAVRQLQMNPHTSEQIVMWYAERMWTLWLLLLALPLSVLVSGCVSLAQHKNALRLTPENDDGATARASGRLMFVVTAIAALILAIVVLHMLAN